MQIGVCIPLRAVVSGLTILCLFEVAWITANGGRVLTDGIEVADMEVVIPKGTSTMTITRRGVRTTRALAVKEGDSRILADSERSDSEHFPG